MTPDTPTTPDSPETAKTAAPSRPGLSMAQMKRTAVSTRFAVVTLLIAAACLLLLALFAGRGDLTTAMLILAAVACFFGSLFVLSSARRPGIDPEIAMAMGAAGSINSARMFADLGIHGPAVFVPVDPADGWPAAVMQVNMAEGTDVPWPLPVGGKGGETVFFEQDGKIGVVSVPAGWPVFSLLKDKYGVHVPDDKGLLFLLLQEIARDILNVGEDLAIERSDSSLIIRHSDVSADGSHNQGGIIYTVVPEPIPSLLAVFLVAGLQKSYHYEQNIHEPNSRSVLYTFTEIEGE
ncbi:MAG: hypothetical protein JXA08_09110 [Methanomicrobiaceae archaeon]|nr:hypothetical protein [Methanomicrobiaceae archaeon]